MADLTGLEFDRLTVKKKMGRDKWRKTLWLCDCSCGSGGGTLATASDLKSGKKRSCGCYRRELLRATKWKGCGDISGDYWSLVKRNAKAREIEFCITIEEAWALFEEQRGICALSGRTIVLSRNLKLCDQTASLDRKDSSIGYVKGNIQWLHKTVNLCKNVLSQQEFIDLCNEVVSHPRS